MNRTLIEEIDKAFTLVFNAQAAAREAQEMAEAATSKLIYIRDLAEAKPAYVDIGNQHLDPVAQAVMRAFKLEELENGTWRPVRWRFPGCRVGDLPSVLSPEVVWFVGEILRGHTLVSDTGNPLRMRRNA